MQFTSQGNRITVRKFEGNRYLGDLDVDWRIILK
jgi:hypothetical protein